MTQTSAVGPGIELAGQGRRLGGYVLDIVLFVVTLGIGWIIWYLVVGQRGQSPAKQILGIRVVREDGNAAGLGWMLIRDLVVRGIGLGAITAVLVAIAGNDIGNAIGGLVFVVAALWCVWDANRQCLWDKAVGTYVVTGMRDTSMSTAASPSQEAGENLRTLGELHERGLLTDEEYEERRAREVERL